MKVCILYPNIMKFPKEFEKIGTIPSESILYLPLGVLYVISNSNYKVDFLDNRVEKLDNKQLVKRLKKYDVVGFSGTILEQKQAKEVSSKLRKLGVVTIYGGPNATLNWQNLTDYFDFIVKGEGEITFNELLFAIENKNPKSKILGIVYKDKKTKKVVETANRPFIKDLDTLKYPGREILDLSLYITDSVFGMSKNKKMFTVCSSRGCPYDCTFCSSRFFWQRSYRKRKVDEVIKEIKYLISKYKIDAVYFREDLFVIPKAWVLDFCKKIKSLNIEWACESRVNVLDDDLLKAMSNAGCKGIEVGAESVNELTLVKIRKGITIEQMKKAIELCHKYNIKITGMFIVGFPWESKRDIVSNINGAKKMGFDSICLFRLIGFPRSELYQEIKSKKLYDFEYEDILIPRTEYLSTKEVNNIYYSQIGGFFKRNIWFKLPESIKSKIRAILK